MICTNLGWDAATQIMSRISAGNLENTGKAEDDADRFVDILAKNGAAGEDSCREVFHVAKFKLLD